MRKRSVVSYIGWVRLEFSENIKDSGRCWLYLINLLGFGDDW